MMETFNQVHRATFLDRPNRFLIRCHLDEGQEVLAYLPNPGRLRELLLPDAQVSLVESSGGERRTRFTAVAVDRRPGAPIMLHTHRTNDVARHLIDEKLVPGLEGFEVAAAEVTVGHSRFDFRLETRAEHQHEHEKMLLEVKSCTLVSGAVAMFPDAITARGARHVRELAELGRGGVRTGVLFVVHWPEARIFSPDYHTDLTFAEALLESRHYVEIRAMAVGWSTNLELKPEVRPCRIPWELIGREAQDRGAYLALLELPEAMELETGKLGPVDYRAGWYLYVGSAMANLTRRIERHRRLRKRKHWHIDHLRERARFVEALPVRASDRLECELAAALGELADWSIPRFGASDCGCPAHLFGFEGDPRSRAAFQELLLGFRMDRLEELIPPT
jgi:sugar fermentation stimulation protein A